MLDTLETSAAVDDLFGEAVAAEEPTEQFVTFRLGPEWYAVPIAQVREVVRCGQISYLPSAPPHVAGVINLRGNIITVTDPKRLFGQSSPALTGQHRVVVIETAAAETGLLVDEVGEVAAVALSQLEPPLVTIEPAQAVFVAHTCRWENRLLAILKGDKLVAVGGPVPLAEG